MKNVKFILALMATALMFLSCQKDDDEPTVQTRLVQVEETGSEYNWSKTFTYNAEGYVSQEVYTYNSESSSYVRTTDYIYNAEGQPVQWEISGAPSDNGVYTASITPNTVTITEPSGNEVIYTLNSNGRAIEKEDGDFFDVYTWSGDNLFSVLSNDYFYGEFTYDLDYETPVPALGVSYWTENSKNMIIRFDWGTESEQSTFYEYSYTYNEEGKPVSGTHIDYLWDVENTMTFTYEEYE